ncbi:hypothetical protein [Catenuloplanes indicus]|uniref:Uncharacterized protein n=1 Tax=Catenuloplanes indicus TaxID=137267 RepID=A0AAE3VWU3_9ACTN|nr:hypothetical protein [Catenuloplanes indicus]MDQ0364495.1 hypothetical protein [Catenuloplanes indicus]
MFPPLATAIDGLYATFAPVPLPESFSYCGGCCFSAEEARVLLTPRPLREVTAEALRYYRSNLFSMVGGVPDFRYFLPRVLELTAAETMHGRPMAGDLEWELRALVSAEWATWAADERAAIDAYLRALWSGVLAGACATPPRDVLAGISAAEPDLAPMLAEWASSLARPAAAGQLAGMLNDYRGDPDVVELSCWSPASTALFAEWLFGAGLRRAIAAAAIGAGPATYAHLAEIRKELDYLVWCRAWRTGDPAGPPQFV